VFTAPGVKNGNSKRVEDCAKTLIKRGQRAWRVPEVGHRR
jgi:hypothetical protein